MSTSKHMLPEVVEKHCGRINTDIFSGWEKGIGPTPHGIERWFIAPKESA
ncbi:hypothetical protein D7249_24895 [Stutzerimonas stutzeri]|nr:hypothetical protein [Comamonas sp.]